MADRACIRSRPSQHRDVCSTVEADYGYDTSNGERRGLPTSLTHTGSGRTVSVLGGYDADGRLVTQSFPDVTGGLTQDWGYDPAGQAMSLAWSGAGGEWFSHQVTRTGLGQVAVDSNSASGQQRAYLYDGAGRLAAVDSQEAEGCVRTRYSWDANSNRVATLTYSQPGQDFCNLHTTATSAATAVFDEGDRLVAAGLVYDGWGRVTALPAALAPTAGAVSLSYRVNDLAASATTAQGGVQWSLDAAGRLACARRLPAGGSDSAGCGATATAGVVDTLEHCGDERSDSPLWSSARTGGGGTTHQRTVRS